MAYKIGCKRVSQGSEIPEKCNIDDALMNVRADSSSSLVKCVLKLNFTSNSPLVIFLGTFQAASSGLQR